MLLREYVAGVKPDCPTCQGPMHQIMLPSYQRAGNGFTPIVIHEGDDGTFSFPMHSEAPIREGFRKVEIRTFAEADAIMKKVNAIERRTIDERVCNEQRHLEEVHAKMRSDLRQQMRSMSPAGRAFAEAAMRHNDAKAPQHFDPHAFIEVREFDRSNREAYRDRETDWKQRHG